MLFFTNRDLQTPTEVSLLPKIETLFRDLVGRSTQCF